MRLFYTTSIILFLLIQGCSTNNSSEEKFDIDWMYSDQGRLVGSVYKSAWIDDNTVYLMDMRKPKEQRTLLKMDPMNSDVFIQLIVKEKIAKDILSAVGRTDTTMYLEWPSSFSSSGEFGLYTFEDDIYLLDIKNQDYTRITRTKNVEKAARFSPDGKKISFVRENDIYIYDIDTKREKRITFTGTDTNLNGTVSWVYW